jgi:Domain of unknown function (DUF4157)
MGNEQDQLPEDDSQLQQSSGDSALADNLSDDLAKKYDPERLLKIMSARAGRGDALDQTVRNRYERKFGVDLGHVRVLTGEFAEKFNKERNAHAVTIGSTGLVLMGGSADRSMASGAGRALLAHELTHVAQAKRGLHFKGGSEQAFSNQEEQEAQQVEAEELSGGAEPKKVSANDRQKVHEQEVAKIQERVLEMLGDVGEMQLNRAGNMRRP